jgi:hypothetical protein
MLRVQAVRALSILILIVCAAGAALAQQAPLKSPLLDHLAGKWVLQGTISGQQTTHDVDAEWVLDHHYLRIHEISRDKNKNGKPQYEATIYVAWNDQTKQYAAVWLDVYGGLTPGSIGVADSKDNELPFVFKNENGEIDFTNDFIFDPKAEVWEWRMDNVDKGVVKPFGRVKLTRG